MVARQTRYEQLTFWRNPFGAAFTIGFSTIFLILLAASAGTARVDFLGNIHAIQYYVAGFLAYGVMSACFNTLAISIVVRRETGLLKRLRLTPLPTWAVLGAIFANAVIVSAVQVVLLLAIGRLGYGVRPPHNYLALVIALFVGIVCFTALGVAASTVIPNQDAAGPVLGIVFFVLLWLSGLWYPIKSGSGLARVSSVFPVRHLIVSTFAPFDLRPGVSGWAWGDVAVLAAWAVVGAVVAVRRFRWEPRRG
jgi:ABC-2 type transport system permease protein